MKNVVMHLKKDPFEKVKSGSKVVELRLYDDKRKALNVGDTITFVLLNDETKKIKCEIVNLLVYDNFEELFADYDPVELGYNEGEKSNAKDMEKFYSRKEQEENQVVAIEFEII